MARIEPDWSRISEDLLFSIVKFLPARTDILRLRAVCRSFRATIPPPPIQYPFPHSILTTTDFLEGPNPNRNDVYNLTASTLYAIEPLNKISNTQDDETRQTWVVKVDESNSGRVRIIDPITDVDHKNLSEKSLNLLDYRVTEIGKHYELDSAVRISFFKVVFSSFLDEHNDEFAVMASYGDAKKLGMWRNVDKKWSRIGKKISGYVADLSYHNHKFYALYDNGRTVSVDPKTLIVTQVAAEVPFASSFVSSSPRLVGSFEDLFLVRQYEEYGDDYDEDRYYVEVFKLNEKKRKWVRVVDRLDFIDRVLFVGEICTFSVSVKEFPRFKGACIYYPADRSDGDDSSDRIWIWDFDDGAFGHISVFPGYLNFFWPPPAWLKYDDKRKPGMWTSPRKVLFPFSILSATDFLSGPNPDVDDLFVPSESTVYAIEPMDNETSQT